jgi:hypothetical protein
MVRKMKTARFAMTGRMWGILVSLVLALYAYEVYAYYASAEDGYNRGWRPFWAGVEGYEDVNKLVEAAEVGNLQAVKDLIAAKREEIKNDDRFDEQEKKERFSKFVNGHYSGQWDSQGDSRYLQSGDTALIAAAKGTRRDQETPLKVLQYLLRLDEIDANAASTVESATPLIGAIQKGNPKAVEILVASKKVDINKIGSGGRSPVMYAAELDRSRGAVEIMNLLLDAKPKPDLTIVSKTNRTVKYYAKDATILGLLEKAGAK